MTAPLTPPDSDLQDFPFMPLHVARLRDSDLAAEEKPEACWYAVLLWAAAWHQLPAGSLPDNDAVLTKLIGLGRDIRTFRKHRDGALRGFIKCDDGRLYHPIVAEQVIAAWESKLQQRWRTECARIKKINQRSGCALQMPTYEEFIAPGYEGPKAPPGPSPVPEDNGSCPAGQTLQETGTGTGTGISKKEAIASSVAEATPKPKDRSYPEAFEAAWRAYPHHKGRSSKPKALIAWKALPADERAGLVAAIGRFAPNVPDTCGGKGAPDMALWLRDGKHLNWQGDDTANAPPSGPTFNAPQVRASIVRATDEDFAARYVDHYCRWVAEGRRLEARTPAVAAALTSKLAEWAKRNDVTIAVAAANDPKPDLSARGAAA